MNIETTLRQTILGMATIGLALTMTFSACDFLDPSPDATVSSSVSTDDECDDITSVQVGSTLYRCECASCHGLDGTPLTTQITDVRGFTSDVKFQASLNNGPGSMPAYPQLDSAQRAALLKYVRDSL